MVDGQHRSRIKKINYPHRIKDDSPRISPSFNGYSDFEGIFIDGIDYEPLFFHSYTRCHDYKNREIFVTINQKDLESISLKQYSKLKLVSFGICTCTTTIHDCVRPWVEEHHLDKSCPVHGKKKKE